ncbi:hypothetical protein BGX30_005864 [Mortierella sp. GBA39]|nr:hypothetical protein BGX30_005864 [Mortierella sp. GBA39]
MTKKDLCLALWGQIVQDTKVFAHQVLDKITLHKPSSSSSSTSGSTHGSTMDHHYTQPQQQHSPPHQQEQQQHQKQRKQPYQYQHRPLSPHYQQIYTPYRHVYFSSTLSLNVHPTNSCASLSTINSTTIASASNSNDLLASQQFESLWEVQLALGEIPGMIEGNILESCEDPTAVPINTAAVTSKSGSSFLLPPLLPLAQQSHTSLLSIPSTTSTQPWRTYVAFEEFSRYPSTSDESDSESDYDSEDDEEGVEEEEDEIDAAECFIFQPFPQQPQPHPLLRIYSSSYRSSNNPTTSSLYLSLNTTPENNNNTVNNYTGSIYSIEPHPLQHRQVYEDEEEVEEALTFSRRLFRGNNTTTTSNAIAITSNASFCSNTDNGTGTSALLPSDLRSDRKDSGVFIHDEQDGIIVKLSPRLAFSSSESESESEVEHGNNNNTSYGPQYRSCNVFHPSEHTNLRSRWMNGVTCIPNTNTSSVNVTSCGGGARDRRNSTTTLQRREYIASTSFSSSPTTTSTSTTSTFPSLMAAVSFISMQA